MINYSKKTIDRIKDWNKDNIHILADFDRTLTVGESVSSWGILSSGGFLSPKYCEERQKLYEKYRPIEIDENLPFEEKNRLMIEWWTQHINLLVKYKLTEETIVEATKDIKVMKFRDGAVDFLGYLYENNIPVIIMSAGVGNFIEQFLHNNNCYFSNIYIISNFIKFENGVAVGIESDIIHSLNKREDLLPEDIKERIKDRPNVILLGDQIGDTTMIAENKKENTLKIGFCEEKVEENIKYFNEVYDVVCTDKVNFNQLRDELDILK